MKKRLIWLCPEFTPYHEVLFRALAADPEISLQVEVMFGPTQTHPFDLSTVRSYEWGQTNPHLRVDHNLIAKILRESDAWVVVASYLKPTLMAAMKALAKENRKFLYYTDTPLSQLIEWNRDRPRGRSWLRRSARAHRLSWIFRKAHHVLATGQPGVESVIKLGCPKEKAVVFPYWVDLPSLRKVPSIAEKGGTLLAVGQLTYRKGYDIAIKALGKAIQTANLGGVQLHVVGEGPERQNLERLAVVEGLGGRVVFHGWLQPPQVAEIMNQATAIVHTARWEPFGVAVLEAMATGLPVLGSADTMAALDRIEDGVSGFIHRTEDVEQLTEHMIKIFSDPEISARMGLAARRQAEEWPPERGVEIIKDIIMTG